jgi:cysteine desulfurase/selenocysteine lyase
VIVTTELEHHSNYVPWQQLAKRKRAKLAVIPVDANGELQLEALSGLASLGHVRLVSLSVVSNALGTVNPVKEVIAWAREQGAVVVLDAAQAAPHRRLDVQELDCDFLALSAHKLGGPSGVGALYGRRELLAAWPPAEYGGGMIARVDRNETSFAEAPYKFEAGTPAIAEAVAFAAALDYLDAIGLDAVSNHERSLVEYALAELDHPTLSLYGPPPSRRSGIVSFNVQGVHPHDVAQILDSQGVAVRAGHHCAQPLMRRLGLQATTRASFWLYSTREDVDRLVRGLEKVRRTFA